MCQKKIETSGQSVRQVDVVRFEFLRVCDSHGNSSESSNDQINLSERLQLLHELGNSNLYTRYHASRVRRSQANHDIRFLDTTALALTTGKQGEFFVAALDTHEHIQLVLAKNGIPTSEDVAAANELMSLIGSATYASGLVPFLLRRCGTNINKRIHNLNISIQNTELLDGFQFALQTYVPMSDIQAMQIEK